MQKLVFILFLFSSICLNTFGQKNLSFLGNLQYNQKVNDIWGYTDDNGNEYALVGGTTGTSIVDISNPTAPTPLFFIQGDTSIWRDIKTYQNFAYVTNEEGGGLLIIDLSDLPNSIDFQNWKIDTVGYETAHNIFIDEFGFAYLLGSNIGNRGAVILDLNFSNKFKPPMVGIYDDKYVHDAFVRDNIMWTAEVYEGNFSVVDVSNKQQPIILARQRTSRGFTHQVWLSDDDNYLITNDEKAGAYIDIYDVSNLNNIERLDKYRSHPDDNVIPHNTYFKGKDFFFTSYYRDGVTLVDATKKDNIVEVGYFDTSPLSSDDGFEGCWGVYPYLPSGNIIASDREEGLFILSPTYKRAAYLEGIITDTSTNTPIKDMRVEIIGTNYIKESIFGGNYKIGVADEGFYDVRFSFPNCKTIIVSGIELLEGLVYDLNIETNCQIPVSINSIEEKKPYQILPNPFKDKLSINIDQKSKLNSVTIYNASGKEIKKVKVNENIGRLDFLNNWDAGTYFLTLEFEHKTYSETIIKTK